MNERTFVPRPHSTCFPRPSPNLAATGWHRRLRLGTTLPLILATTLGLRAATVLEIGQNFTGSRSGTESDATPADANGAIGPAHYVELINGRFSVYDRTNGRRVRTMTDLIFWKNAGLALPTRFAVTDPRVIFDPDTQRWFASMVDFDASTTQLLANRFLLAVSDSNDPTKTWRAFAFAAAPNSGMFADYPTLGLDARAVYLSADRFTASGSQAGAILVAIPKAGLVANPPSIDGRTLFDSLTSALYGQVLQPSVALGPTDGSEVVLAVADKGVDGLPHNTLKTCAIADGDQPGLATLGTRVTLSVPAYTAPGRPPQSGGDTTLDGGDTRFSGLVYRLGNVLYAVHTVKINGRGALQWFKLDAVSRTVIQTGTVTHNSLDLFFPSIAANAAGVAVIACNGSSSKSFIGSYAVLGEEGSGGLKFGDLTLLKAGSATYSSPGDNGESRWGDYSATSPDPSDPNRFWTIQMVPSAKTAWFTQITELIATPVRLAIQMDGTNVVLSWSAAASSYQLQTADTLGSAPTWTSPGVVTSVSNGRIVATLPATTERRFFRLAKP